MYINNFLYNISEHVLDYVFQVNYNTSSTQTETLFADVCIFQFLDSHRKSFIPRSRNFKATAK